MTTPWSAGALIFDCDGVLVNSEEIVQEIELELLSAHGLHYDRDEFSRRFLGVSDEHFYAVIRANAFYFHDYFKFFEEKLFNRGVQKKAPYGTCFFYKKRKLVKNPFSFLTEKTEKENSTLGEATQSLNWGALFSIAALKASSRSSEKSEAAFQLAT